MINAIAIAIVFSTVGLVMVLLPEQLLAMSLIDGERVLKLTKEVVEDTLSSKEETLVDTKDALTKAVEVVAKPIEKSMGWFRRKPKLEDQSTMVKEKIDFENEATNEATIELEDETLEKMSLTTQSIKDKIIGDKTLQTNGATKNVIDLGGGYKIESAIHKIGKTTKGIAKDEYISPPKILEFSKEKKLDEIEGTQDSIYNQVGHIKEKLQEVAKGVENKAHDVGVKTKDIITLNIVDFSRDKVNENVRHSQDVIVESLELGLEKTKSTIVDVSNKMKEIVEHSIQDTKEIGYGILEKAKDATCKIAECWQSQTQDVESYSCNLDQGGFGHVYNEGHTSKGATTSIGENVEEIGEDSKSKPRDFTNHGMNSARRSYGNMKNIGDHYFDERSKNHVGESYDVFTNTAQEYYDKIGQHYKKAKDYYDGSIHHHNTKGDGRSSSKGATDISSQSFDDDANDEDDGYFYNIKDLKTKHAFDDAYHRTKNFDDNARDKRNGYTPNGREEKRSREYISMAKQRNANGHHDVHDQANDYYKNAKLKPKKDLGAMVESMGWRRVGIIASNDIPISSNDEVVIGNVKYKWDNKDEHPSHQTTSNSVLNPMRSAKHNIGERIDLAQEHITRSAQNVQDVDIQGKDQIHDASQALHQKKSFHLFEYPWTNRKSQHEEYEDDNNDNEDDDYFSHRKIRNHGKGRVRNGGYLHKFPRFRRNEYANLVKKDLLDFTHYDEDKKNMDKGHVLRFWKDIFLRRPKGFFLLLTRALHLFTFSIIYGSSFWVTFVSGFILSKHIPRQQFGYVQSRIFPMYLRILIVGQSVLFILHSILHPWFIANSVERLESSNFGLMIASTIVNAYILEPQATKVMFERLKVEKEEGRGLENMVSPMDAKLLMEEHKKQLGRINQQFKTLHNYSSTLNLISLGGLTCHLWQLAHHLVI